MTRPTLEFTQRMAGCSGEPGPGHAWVLVIHTFRAIALFSQALLLTTVMRIDFVGSECGTTRFGRESTKLRLALRAALLNSLVR